MSISQRRQAALIESALIGKGKDQRYTTHSVTEAVEQAIAETRQNTINEVIKAADELNERLAAVLRLKFGGQ